VLKIAQIFLRKGPPTMSGEHHLEVIYPLHIHGYDLSITLPVVIMWGTAFVIFSFLFLANKSEKLRKIQRYLYNFITTSFGDGFKKNNRLFFSFLITLYLFILFNNLSGLIPGGESPSSNINVTAALAIMVFIVSIASGIRVHGLHFAKHFVPGGIPKVIIPFFVPLEIISQLARPFSLAVRLFANMFAGHKVLTIFCTLAILANPFIKALPFAGVVLISMFEIFVAFIQAFIFTYLTSFYLREAVADSH